jgi:hypothetical protein
MCGAISLFPQYTFMAWCSVETQGLLALRQLMRMCYDAMTGEPHNETSYAKCKLYTSVC